ncbi:MAG: hypothetical protein M1817_003961 [Caeruleum heppii]|nr:MAG: hypothetical protein M1817_003961 [Caeruleum heppii]
MQPWAAGKMLSNALYFGLIVMATTLAAPVAEDPGAAAAAAAAAAFGQAPGLLTRRQTYNCDTEWMRAIEAQGWADAEALANEAFKWSPGGRWQPAMDLYMGKDSVQSPYRGQIVSGLQNQRDAHRPNALFPEAVISTYCGDSKAIDGRAPGSICSRYDRNGAIVRPFASTWTKRGTFYNDYYLVLCPRFFSEKNSLFRTLARMDDGQIDKSNASAYKFTWGHTYFHELMHLYPVVAEFDVKDHGYGACRVASLAASSGCTPRDWDNGDQVIAGASSLTNADSWTFFADAAYFQEAWRLNEPGQPDCGSGFSQSIPEVWWESPSDRTDATFEARSPPPPDAKASALNNAPTPVLPFDLDAAVPNGVATPYPDAEAYFSSLFSSSTSSSKVPQASTKTQDINQGILTCRSENPSRPSGDAEDFMTLDDATASIDEFCRSLRDNNVVLGPGATASQTQVTAAGAIVSVDWEGGSNCPSPPDFSQDGEPEAAMDVCKERLSNAIDSCDTSGTDGEERKQGGRFFRDCVTWEIGK